MAQPLPASRGFITQLLNSLPIAPSAVDATNAAVSNPLDSAPDPVKKQLLALHVLFPNELLPALDLLDRRLITRFRIQKDPESSTKLTPQAIAAAGSEHGTESRIGGNRHGDKVAAESSIDEPNARSGETSTRQWHPSDAETQRVGSAPPHGEQATHVPQIIHREGQVARGVSALQHPLHAHEDRHCQHEGTPVYYVRSAQQRSSRFSTSYDATTCYEVRLTAWNCSCPAFAFASFPAVHPEPPAPVYNPDDHETWGTVGKDEDGNEEWSFGGISIGEGTPPVCKHLLACVLVERCAGLFGAFVEERNVDVLEAAGWAAGWSD
ncbi:hypothetical protein BS50DRAFT_633527 [Corynespora cassiicola Philippines]|uniref:SWIM-type domain-containing protein n=1 Tax=Corynespora cassiicola Philippines TaxID=1448308 RepID=A0A2T2NR60_CORCC|nr:hypothetical protein BS50DRAFT_633527 [Corynespora cassiicola Philippines]